MTFWYGSKLVRKGTEIGNVMANKGSFEPQFLRLLEPIAVESFDEARAHTKRLYNPDGRQDLLDERRCLTLHMVCAIAKTPS
jgi:hypothetical protein